MVGRVTDAGQVTQVGRAGGAFAGVVAALLAAAVLAACGGGGGGAATTKAGWEAEHGQLVGAFSRSLDDAMNNINQGARASTVGACTQVSDDAKELSGQAFPVPDPAVDAALRKAVDAGAKAAGTCLSGARGGGAHDIEKAQVEFVDARKAMDEAEVALKNWS